MPRFNRWLLLISLFISVTQGCIPTISPDDDDLYEEWGTTSLATMVSEVTSSTTNLQTSTSDMGTSTEAMTTTTTTGTSTTSTSTTTTTTTGLPTTTTTGMPTTTTPAGTQCNPMWNFNSGNHYCYRLLNDGMDEAGCMAIGGNLASIHDAAENSFVMSLMATAGLPVVIGLVGATTTGPWMWTDGTEVNYFNWDGANGFPMNDGVSLCVQVVWTMPGYWQNSSCGTGYYMCKSPAF